MPLCTSVYLYLVVTCWERADLLALVCGVSLSVCHFPIGILGQVWYLIVSIPDLCTLTYFCSFLHRFHILTTSCTHWRSSHYTHTHVRNKNSNIQGRSPNVVKVLFHIIRYCSLRKEFAPQREQILLFKRSFHFEKGRN